MGQANKRGDFEQRKRDALRQQWQQNAILLGAFIVIGFAMFGICTAIAAIL